MELLRAAWIAGTLPILIASLPCSWLGSFHGLVLGFARRGKIMQSSSHRVSSEFFSIFLNFRTCLSSVRLIVLLGLVWSDRFLTFYW